MKKIFLTVIMILTAVFIMPCVCANAEEAALDDVPMFDEDFIYGQSKKAYICQIYDKSAGLYTLIYRNSKSSKLLYSSKKDFKYAASISEDGTTAFYRVNDSIYRYSYSEDKTKKIYTIPKEEYSIYNYVYLYSSPDGEYCMFSYSFNKGTKVNFKLWHDGKIVSDKTYSYNKSRFDVSVSNDGKAIYIDAKKLYSFSFDTGKKKLFASAPSDEYSYKTEIFQNKGTYVMYGCMNKPQDTDNDGPDYIIYSGKLYEEPKLIYSGNIVPENIIACNGEALILYDGEHIVRIDLESGKEKNIVKLSPKLLEKSTLSGYFLCSDDLDSVAYVNYSKNKLVRLSGWSSKKNAYTKRGEIDLNGTKKELMRYHSDDLRIIAIINAESDAASNKYTNCAAFFDEKKLVPADNIVRIDRFGHVICRNTGSVDILYPDGSVKNVFDRYNLDSYDEKSGYFLFYTQVPTLFDSDGEERGGICYDYYIDENGDAVLLWEGRFEYEIIE